MLHYFSACYGITLYTPFVQTESNFSLVNMLKQGLYHRLKNRCLINPVISICYTTTSIYNITLRNNIAPRYNITPRYDIALRYNITPRYSITPRYNITPSIA